MKYINKTIGRWVTLLLILIVSCPGRMVLADEDEKKQHASNIYLYSVEYDRVIYEKNSDEKAYPASLTKVATALLVMEALEAGTITRDQPVTMQSEDYRDMNSESSTSGLVEGETITVEDLLYCLLLPSGNEAAGALARIVSGDRDSFVAAMNEKCQTLGLTGTHFVNPHGLHDEDHYSTAHDMGVFFNEALKYDLFCKIIATPSYTLPATNRQESRTVNSSNVMISTAKAGDRYLYEDCIGGKTGTTGEAGLCLVSAARHQELTYIAVVMGAPFEYQDGQLVPGQFIDSRVLYDWVFSAYQEQTVITEGAAVASLPVAWCEQAEEVSLVTTSGWKDLFGPELDPEGLKTEVHLTEEQLYAPVEAGTVYGTLEYRDAEGTIVKQIDLCAAESLERSTKLYREYQIKAFFSSTKGKILTATGIVALILLIWCVRRSIIRKRRKKRKKRAVNRKGPDSKR